METPKQDVNASWGQKWTISQSWCHSLPLFWKLKDFKQLSAKRWEETKTQQEQERRTCWQTEREGTEFGRSVLKTGEHPFAYALPPTLPHFLLPTCPPPHPATISPPLVSCIPPPWENRDNKLAFFSQLGPGRRTLGQPSECPPGVPMDLSCPFPFQSTRKQSLCQHLSLRKLVKVMALLAIAMTTGEKNRGPTKDCSNAGVVRRKSWTGRGETWGFDNGGAVASFWLYMRMQWCAVSVYLYVSISSLLSETVSVSDTVTSTRDGRSVNRLKAARSVPSCPKNFPFLSWHQLHF